MNTLSWLLPLRCSFSSSQFVAVSIGVSNVSVIIGTGEVETCLLLAFFLALVTGGCSVVCAGMGAVTDLGIYTVVGVVTFVEAGSMSFAGEAVVDLSSAFFGDFFFFRVTSIHSSIWSGSFPVIVSLMVAVETVVATVSVATVAAAAAGTFGGSFLGQNFDICPNCLQLKQCGRLPSTTTIICLSLPTMVSGIVWKPSRVRHIRNTQSP